MLSRMRANLDLRGRHVQNFNETQARTIKTALHDGPRLW
jgi:hypothetical protein